MRLLVAGLTLFVLNSCSEELAYRAEDYHGLYRQPRRRGEHSNVERKKIVRTFAEPGNPKKPVRERIGILERNEVTLEGTRQVREQYVILDRHFEQVGFITAEGQFYRFDETGRRTFVGEYVIGDDPERKMFMTGLKVFFHLPLSENLALEEIDPYGDF